MPSADPVKHCSLPLSSQTRSHLSLPHPVLRPPHAQSEQDGGSTGRSTTLYGLHRRKRRDTKQSLPPPLPPHLPQVGRRAALRLAAIEGVLPAGLLADGPVVTKVSATATGAVVQLSSVTSAGLALVPTLDCATTAGLPKPYNDAAHCCAFHLSETQAFGFPFELQLADSGTWLLADAAIDASASTVTLTPLDPSASGAFSGVRYSWSGFPSCVLSNSPGLPVTPFMLPAA